MHTYLYTHAYMNTPNIPREICTYAHIDKCILVNMYGYNVVIAHIHFHAYEHGTLLQVKPVGMVDLPSQL